MLAVKDEWYCFQYETINKPYIAYNRKWKVYVEEDQREDGLKACSKFYIRLHKTTTYQPRGVLSQALCNTEKVPGVKVD